MLIIRLLTIALGYIKYKGSIGDQQVPSDKRRLTIWQTAARINNCPALNSGPVAQLGARFHGMEEVVGSIPTRSTNFFQSLATIAIPQFVYPRGTGAEAQS